MPNGSQENLIVKDAKTGAVVVLTFVASRSVFGLIITGLLTAGVVNYLHYTGQKKLEAEREHGNADMVSFLPWPFNRNQAQQSSDNQWMFDARRNIVEGGDVVFDVGLEAGKKVGAAIYHAAGDTISRRLNSPRP